MYASLRHVVGQVMVCLVSPSKGGLYPKTNRNHRRNLSRSMTWSALHFEKKITGQAVENRLEEEERDKL